MWPKISLTILIISISHLKRVLKASWHYLINTWSCNHLSAQQWSDLSSKQCPFLADKPRRGWFHSSIHKNLAPEYIKYWPTQRAWQSFCAIKTSINARHCQNLSACPCRWVFDYSTQARWWATGQNFRQVNKLPLSKADLSVTIGQQTNDGSVLEQILMKAGALLKRRSFAYTKQPGRLLLWFFI